MGASAADPMRIPLVATQTAATPALLQEVGRRARPGRAPSRCSANAVPSGLLHRCLPAHTARLLDGAQKMIVVAPDTLFSD